MPVQQDLVKLKKGDVVDHFLLVKKAEIRLTKAGKEYLALELGDKSSSLSANVWDNFKNIAAVLEGGAMVKVSGSIDEFQGTPQIRISSIRLAKPSDGVSPSDFLAKSKRDPKVMKEEFYGRIEKITDSNLKELLKLIFNEENYSKFSKAPAGKSWHHAYIHGLLEHTLEIIRICDLMCDIHSDLNRDLLICGAMLHDYGKTEELSFDSSFDYTDRGRLVGHIVIAAMLVEEYSRKLNNFPQELKDCLIHLILSHQGKLEYASPVVPKTLEAITLYQADELSAKVNAYKNALKEVKDEKGWTRFLNLISTELYSHGINSEESQNNKTLFD